MKIWEEAQDEIRKVRPDNEMARSILKMIKIRLKEVETKDRVKFTSLVVEDYYEIIKEGITALMAIDGYKTLSHEVLVGYLKKSFPQFSDSEIFLIDQLRQLRNKIAYKGFFVNPDFLIRNEKRIQEIIAKFLQFLENKLNKDIKPK